MGTAADSSRSLWSLAAGPALAAGVALAPLPGVEPAAQMTAAIAAWMATWWMTEAVPIAVTSLLPLVAFPATGVLSSPAAAAPYANHLIFLFMGGFFIAKAMQRWGLHRRLALRIVAAVGTGPRRLVLGVMLATALLSMWIPNTAVAVMMLPIGVALIDELGRQSGGSGGASPGEPAAGVEHPSAASHREATGRLGTALMLGIAYSASIGGVATLIGTPPNLVFASMVESLLGGQIDFVAWMGVGLPVAALLLPAAWYYLTHIAFPVPSRMTMGRDVMREHLRALGPMSRGEKAAAAIFGCTAVALVLRTEKQVGALVIPGLNSFLPEVSDATIVMAGAIAAFCVPLSLRPLGFTLDWKHGREIRWGILLLFGGGLSLAEAFQASGLSAWITGGVIYLEALPMWLIVAMSATLIIFLTELTSNTATATLVMPVYASAAVGLGIHPYIMMAPAALAASMAFMLPVATPPNAIVFGSGMVTIRQMARAGFVLNLVSIILTTLAALLLVPMFLID
jgi:sodium-dependent dicarboxylate transporter 2/3/5